jgi:hypothetical protein
LPELRGLIGRRWRWLARQTSSLHTKNATQGRDLRRFDLRDDITRQKARTAALRRI